MKRLFLVLGLIFMGCAAATGVVPIGPDTYMVSRQGWISTQSTGELTALALREANDYCNSQNKKMITVSTSSMQGILGRSYPEAQVQFMCLTEGDKDLQRINLKPIAPTIKIENH